VEPPQKAFDFRPRIGSKKIDNISAKDLPGLFYAEKIQRGGICQQKFSAVVDPNGFRDEFDEPAIGLFMFLDRRHHVAAVTGGGASYLPSLFNWHYAAF
jgi:hypothetical protein